MIYFKLPPSANKGVESCWAGVWDICLNWRNKMILNGAKYEMKNGKSDELRLYQIRSPCWCWDIHLRRGGRRWPTIIILFLTLLSTRWLPTKLGALKIYSFIHRPLITYFWGQNWNFSKADKYPIVQTWWWPIGGEEMTINVANHHILHKGKWSHGLSSSARMVTSSHYVIICIIIFGIFGIRCYINIC